jgi:hypothetical protein
LTACGGGSSDSGTANNTNPTPAVTSPSLTTQPQNASVNAGSTATFSVAASGTAPLNYQWLRNGQAVSGATGASYTTAALSTSDNGAIYTVTVSNSAGSLTSNTATLTVNTATVSVLANRVWTTGVNINAATGTANVLYYKSGMADDGTIVAMFAQSDGSRLTLYGSIGTPNAAGTSPTWTTNPVVLDANFNFMPTTTAPSSTQSAGSRYGLDVAPNGNAFAFWANVANCTASSYAPSTPAVQCLYFYGRRYIKASGTWEAPKLITSSRSSYGPPIARINSQGDVAVLFQGWTGGNGDASQTVRRAAIARLANEQAAFVTSTLDWQIYDPTFGPALDSTIHLGLDESGNILLAGARWPTGSSTLSPPPTDIAAVLGTVSAGFGSAPSNIESGVATANPIGFVMGRNGDTAIAWTQNNGSIADSVYAATLIGASGPWTVSDFNVSAAAAGVAKAAMSDDGTARLYLGCTVRRWSKVTNAWAASVNLPTNCALTSTSVVAISSEGNYLSFNAYESAGFSTGRWATYDAASNTMINADVDTSGLPVPSYVLGVPASVFGFTFTPLLSTSGIGAVMLQVNMDQLPTALAPLGIGRSGFNNVWGLYLK